MGQRRVEPKRLQAADLLCPCGAKPANVDPKYVIMEPQSVSWKCERGCENITGVEPITRAFVTVTYD